MFVGVLWFAGKGMTSADQSCANLCIVWFGDVSKKARSAAQALSDIYTFPQELGWRRCSMRGVQGRSGLHGLVRFPASSPRGIHGGRGRGYLLTPSETLNIG